MVEQGLHKAHVVGSIPIIATNLGVQMAKLKWLIDQNILEDSRYQNIGEIISSMGYEVTVRKYRPFIDDSPSPYGTDECVVVHGTIGFVKKCRHYGTYAEFSNMKVSTYIPNMEEVDIDQFLNGRHVLVSVKHLKSTFRDSLFSIFGEDIFIRPDSGTKPFTGLVVNRNSIDCELSALEQIHGLTNDVIVVVSSAVNIKEEHRFVVCNRQVITSSLYMRNNNHVEETECHSQAALDLANQVANTTWQPDPVYTVDIAILPNDTVKIVELNSFACSGWYACDVKKIVTEVSRFTESMFYDDFVFE